MRQCCFESGVGRREITSAHLMVTEVVVGDAFARSVAGPFKESQRVGIVGASRVDIFHLCTRQSIMSKGLNVWILLPIGDHQCFFGDLLGAAIIAQSVELKGE